MVFLIVYLNSLVTGAIIGVNWDTFRGESIWMMMAMVVVLFVGSPICVGLTLNDLARGKDHA
jgi:Na+/citrate or Na+/malate symporter